jgi:RNA polymerase subunit RPABC4/transcription elongation factor Spt4
MQVKNETQFGLAAQIRIIPGWAWTLAAIAFIAAQWFFNLALAHHADAPPAWARPLLGLLAGLAGGCYLLFIGFINRDAKRRGMNAVLWTVVAVLVSNGLGILLYFILRQPLRDSCPQCGHAVQTGYNFCPACNCKLSPSCPQCQRVVGAKDVYCPYCGTSLHTPPAPASSGSPAALPG